MLERDDIIEYSLYNHHSEEEGKLKRKTIYKVTILLSIITIVEVLCGVFVKQGSSAWEAMKVAFILMTIIKAFYIVFTFMHVGEENRLLRVTLMVPYLIFIIDILILLLIEGAAMTDRMQMYIP